MGDLAGTEGLEAIQADCRGLPAVVSAEAILREPQS